MKPIAPSEMSAAKVLPDGVIKALNECIVSAWNGHEAIVKLKDAIDSIEVECCYDCDGDRVIGRAEIFKLGWLNIEGAYRAVGWKVEYNQPGYNEDYYDSFYRFTK